FWEAAPPQGGTVPVALRVAPAVGETTWSYLSRLAGRYGMDPGALLPWWTWAGSRPRDDAGPRDDAEVLLDPAGRQLLARLGGAGEHARAQALPAFGDGLQPAPPGEAAGTGRPAARWKVASAGAHGPAAYGCALCTAARTGRDIVVVRYAQPWLRVCARHQRWMLTAGDGHRHRNLDLRAAPEIAAAPRAWPKVARQATAAGADPGRVFALAHAVVCAWWEQALEWEQERIWPARLRAVADGDAGPRFWWWRIIARDAVVFPETVKLAGALLDPRMQERIWDDHGGGGPVRPFRPDGAFFRELAVRLRRGPGWPTLASPRSAHWCWAGRCMPGRFWTASARSPASGAAGSIPTGTAWTRGGCAPTTAPPRPESNCAPWPNRLRPRAAAGVPAVSGPASTHADHAGHSSPSRTQQHNCTEPAPHPEHLHTP
ncbi:TniQ protein, partial [Streptomyces sp. DvalAA-14]|uniref:TniQ family protein n=1 Tax=unclassified Streptomyces TaxID=2593676 RepID=UPI00081B34DF